MPLITRTGGMTKKIKDATAVPSDVLSGKVFYNNQGRQVGSAPPQIIDDLRTKVIDLTNRSTTTKKFTSGFRVDYSSGHISGWDYSYSGTLYRVNGVNLSDVKRIIGFKLDGSMYIPYSQIPQANGGYMTHTNAPPYVEAYPRDRGTFAIYYLSSFEVYATANTNTLEIFYEPK